MLMRYKQWLSLTAALLLSAILAGCAAAAPTESQQDAGAPLPAAGQPTATAGLPLVGLPSPTAAPGVTVAAETPVAPPTDAPITPGALPPTEEPAANVQVNGPYEQTYFRGRADAPVTMIDYSDFL